jgi:hypothetical protein
MRRYCFKSIGIFAVVLLGVLQKRTLVMTMAAAPEIIWAADQRASTKLNLGKRRMCARIFELAWLRANGDVAHTAQVYILARAVFHPDVQYAVLRNVDRLATAVTTVTTIVVVAVVIATIPAAKC